MLGIIQPIHIVAIWMGTYCHCYAVFGRDCMATTRKITKATKEAIAITKVKINSGLWKSPLFEAKVAKIMHIPSEINALPKVG